MVLACHVILKYHVIKAMGGPKCPHKKKKNDFMVRSPSKYVTILPSLVNIDTGIVKTEWL